MESVFTLLPTFAFIFAFTDFGLMMFRWSTLQNSLREATRYAVTFQTQGGQGQDASIGSIVQQYALGFVKTTDSPPHIFVNYYAPTALNTAFVSGGNVPGNLVDVSIQNLSFGWLAPLSGSYVIVVETDGRPNTATVNFWDRTAAGISSSSSCKDANNKIKGQGGFASPAALPAWTAGHAMNSGGTGYMSNIPAGIIGGIGGTDTGTAVYLLFNSWTTVKTNTYSEEPYNAYPTSGAVSNCAMAPATVAAHNNISDFAWLPTTDVYGSNLINNSYNHVSTSGGHITSITMAQIRNAAFNATDSIASRARTNANLPVTVFAVGLSSSVDDTILQRIANDPDWLSSASCVSSGDCVFNANQPQGTYVFAATAADLIPAFLTLSSQILRLSR